jgi:hypothetical protein
MSKVILLVNEVRLYLKIKTLIIHTNEENIENYFHNKDIKRTVRQNKNFTL